MMKGEWAKILISVSMLQLTRWQVQMLSVLNKYVSSESLVWYEGHKSLQQEYGI